MNLDQLREYKPQILAVSKNYGISDIRVFGSVARGEATQNSDVDFLVSFTRPLGFAYAGYIMALSELLKTKVDVVTEKALKDRLRPHILAEAVPL